MQEKKKICSSAYRCIDVVVTEYFHESYKQIIMERAVNYFLDNYMKVNGSMREKGSRSLSKTIEKLLAYSHQVKKKDYNEIDWERKSDENFNWF